MGKNQLTEKVGIIRHWPTPNAYFAKQLKPLKEIICMKSSTISILAATLTLTACSATQPKSTSAVVKASYFEEKITEDHLLSSSFKNPTYVTGLGNNGDVIFNNQQKSGYELWVGKNKTCYFKVYQIDTEKNLDGTVAPSMTVTHKDGDCHFTTKDGLTSVTAKLEY